MKKKLPLLLLLISLVTSCDFGVSSSSGANSQSNEETTSITESATSAESSDISEIASSAESSVPASESSVPPSSENLVPPSSETSLPPSSENSVPPSSENSVPPSSETSLPPSSEEPQITEYFVTFWKTADEIYETVTVEEGKTVTLPEEPEIEDELFRGWYVDLAAEIVFDHLLPITSDIDVFAKWEQAAPSYTLLHLIGEPENTNLSYISWGVNDYDPRSLLSYDPVTTLYTLEIELGYGAMFKIKEPLKEWNTEETGYDNTELTYLDLSFDSDLAYLIETVNYDIHVLHAGIYSLEVNLNAEKRLTIRYVSEPVSEGVTQNPPPEYTVTFYLDATTYYTEAKASADRDFVFPIAPVLPDKTFAGWFYELAFSHEFFGDELITSDFNLFARFINEEGETASHDLPGFEFHAIGDFKNGDDNVWDITGANSYYHFSYNRNTMFYRLKISIGHDAEFKVKEIGLPWDDGSAVNYGLEYSYEELDRNFNYSYLSRGENNNIRVTLAGEYELLINVFTNRLKVTWIQQATDSGLSQTINSYTWGIVGTHNNWGEPDDFDYRILDIPLKNDRAADVLFHRAIKFYAGDEWKIRENNRWDLNFGAHPDNVLPAGMYNQAEGQNIVVTKTSYYTVVFDGTKLIVSDLLFALRGNALANGWQEDTPLLLVDKYHERLEPRREVYEYSLVIALKPGEFRFKVATVGPYRGLEFSPKNSNEPVNYKVIAPGIYRVTLRIMFSTTNDELLHSFAATKIG